MALLIRVWAKAQVWALARRDAHSFLSCAVSSIVAFGCGNLLFSSESGRERIDVFAASISFVSSGMIVQGLPSPDKFISMSSLYYVMPDPQFHTINYVLYFLISSTDANC